MSAIKFVYISKEKALDFWSLRQENKNIKPCSVYVDKEADRLYFVEEPTQEGNSHGGIFEDLSEFRQENEGLLQNDLKISIKNGIIYLENEMKI